MNRETTLRTELAEREVVLIRRFDAPRERVFRAWTDPAQLARWWGPTVFSNPVCEVDPRPGGAHRIVMRSPEGTDYPIHGVFREVVAPERLVMTMDVTGHPDDWYALLDEYRGTPKGTGLAPLTVTVTFAEDGGGTRLTIRTRFASDADRDAMVKMGMEAGWGQSLDGLEALLAKG